MAQKITPLYSAKPKKTSFAFIGGIKEEIKKITWTEKKELQYCTKIVLGTTFFFGLSVYVVDLMIRGVLHSLGLIGKWIAQ
ncbi:MAG: preprotein translocase subunit SecE [Simkaniaceae bacterium]|nr:preprotein translocase subunit SecE [Simkaniaceae bacterium]